MTSDQLIGASSIILTVVTFLFSLLFGQRSKALTDIEKLQHEVATLQSRLDLCEHERKIATADKLAMYQTLLNAENPAPRKKNG